MSEPAPESQGTVSNEHSAGAIRAPESADTADGAAFAAFDLFKAYLDRKFDNFRSDIAADCEQQTHEIAKKLKTEHSYQFKHIGNGKQYLFNEQINSEVLKIIRAAGNKDYKYIQQIAEDVVKQLHKRNKCIKLADKSPAGWDTVKEYLSDELASDSEDEKRIRSAEGRVIRARNQRKRFNRKRDYRPSNRDDVRPAASATAPAPVSAEPLFRGPRRSQGVAKPTDTCYACNEKGHWRKDCQKTKQSQ